MGFMSAALTVKHGQETATVLQITFLDRERPIPDEAHTTDRAGQEMFPLR